MDEFESLSHSAWECKYHIVFIPKCRRKTLYRELRQHLGEVFRRLAKQKESQVEEGHLMPDHVEAVIREYIHTTSYDGVSALIRLYCELEEVARSQGPQRLPIRVKSSKLPLSLDDIGSRENYRPRRTAGSSRTRTFCRATW